MAGNPPGCLRTPLQAFPFPPSSLPVSQDYLAMDAMSAELVLAL